MVQQLRLFRYEMTEAVCIKSRIFSFVAISVPSNFLFVLLSFRFIC